MKLNTNPKEIERFGITSENSFTIKTTAKAFDILSSGLYSDPILAVVRELSCNAYDAHVAANKPDEPFQIHLPNSIEPFFSVTDYGTGLSDEDIRGAIIPTLIENEDGKMEPMLDSNGNEVVSRSGGLYTTYFDSTKTDSNKFIGALGLGSKSPFSYTDSFEVTSIHDGVQRLYSIFLNEDGIPTVALMGELETTESNGFQVKFSVKNKDFTSFADRTSKALKWFPIKPIVVGLTDFKFATVDVIAEGDTWKLVKNRVRFASRSASAVQGNVEYKLEIEQLKKDLPRETYNTLSSSNVVLFFDIGEVDIAASREEIRYSKYTIKNIINKLKHFKQDVVRELEKLIRVFNKSLWFSILEIERLSMEMFGNRDTIREFLKGSALETQVPSVAWYIKHGAQVFISRDQLQYFDLGFYSPAKHNMRLYRQPNTVETIPPRTKTAVINNDIKTGGVGLMTNFIQTTPYSSVVMIRRLPSGRKKENIAAADAEYKQIVERMGTPDIITLSDVVDIKLPTKTNNTDVVSYYKFAGVSSPGRTARSQTVIQKCEASLNDDTFADGNVYVLVKRGTTVCYDDEGDDVYSGGHYFLYRNLQTIIDIINEHNPSRRLILGKNVHGVPMRTYRKLLKLGKWINVFDLGRKVINQYGSEIEFLSSATCSQTLDGFRREVKTNAGLRKQIRSLPTNSLFRSKLLPYIDKVEQFDDDKIKIAQRILNTSMLTTIITKTVSNTPVSYFNNDLFDTYPMVNFITSRTAFSLQHLKQDDSQMIIDYITMVDNNR